MAGNITDLMSLYTHLEETAITYRYPHQIADLFSKLADQMLTEKRRAEALKAQWEITFFFFSLTDSCAYPFRKKTDQNGNLTTFPNFNSFKPKTYIYLKERMDKSVNPLLKARYAHILWLSPRKQLSYAQIAADAYLSLVGVYEEKDKENPSEHFGLNVLNSALTTWALSRTINDEIRTDFAKKEIIRLLFYFNEKSSSLFKVRADIIELMVSDKSQFS